MYGMGFFFLVPWGTARAEISKSATFFLLFLMDVVQGVWIEFWRLIRHLDCQLQITYFTLHYTSSCISNCD